MLVEALVAEAAIEATDVGLIDVGLIKGRARDDEFGDVRRRLTEATLWSQII